MSPQKSRETEGQVCSDVDPAIDSITIVRLVCANRKE